MSTCSAAAAMRAATRSEACCMRCRIFCSSCCVWREGAKEQGRAWLCSMIVGSGAGAGAGASPQLTNALKSLGSDIALWVTELTEDGLGI